MTRFVPRERLELAANKAYWDPKRVPKIDQRRAAADARSQRAHRRAAVRPGRLDRGARARRDGRRSQQRGFKIYSNPQPHVWPWQLSFAEGSPWLDKRVRQAANLCVDRDGLKQAAGRHDGRAQGHRAARAIRGGATPSSTSSTTPKAAQALMTEAGYSAAKPLKVKVQISASGSGQMQPLPMNEFVQQSLKAVLLRRRSST